MMRHLFGHRIYVASAGVRVGEIDGFAIAAMQEIGLDISTHVPQSLNELHDSNFDLVISLAPEAHHRAMELTRTMAIEAEYWPTVDPSLTTGNREQVLGTYRQVRDGLFARIRSRFVANSPSNP